MTRSQVRDRECSDATLVRHHLPAHSRMATTPSSSSVSLCRDHSSVVADHCWAKLEFPSTAVLDPIYLGTLELLRYGGETFVSGHLLWHMSSLPWCLALPKLPLLQATLHGLQPEPWSPNCVRRSVPVHHSQDVPFLSQC